MITSFVDGNKLTVLYDSDCGICTATARGLVRLDKYDLLRFKPLTTRDIAGAPDLDRLVWSLHAVDNKGSWFSGAQATVEIARRVPVLRLVALVARIPGAMIVLGLGYRLVAANRHWLSRKLGLKACRLPETLFDRPEL